MSRVLVTGGAGFIGSHLCERLVHLGHKVVVLDDFSSSSSSNLSSIPDTVEVIEGDIRALASFERHLADIDLVFHLGARISGYESLSEYQSYFDVNVTGTMQLVELCRKLTKPRVVFASSSTVYGPNAGAVERCSEDQLPAPQTVYALTKWTGESLLRMYAPLYDFTAVSLRLFNVYGPRQSPSHPYANVTCKFAQAAAAATGVTLYGDGEQSRDFIFIDDVIEAMVAVIGDTPSDIYNVGTGRTTSINGLLSALREISEAELPTVRRPPWPNDTRRVCADARRLARDLAWGPRVSLEDGLRRTVAWFAANPGLP